MATTEEALTAMRVQREQLPEVLRVLAQHRGVKTYEMAAAIGVSSPSMSSRLHGKVVILQHELPALAIILELGHASLATTSRYLGLSELGDLRKAMEGRSYIEVPPPAPAATGNDAA